MTDPAWPDELEGYPVRSFTPEELRAWYNKRRAAETRTPDYRALLIRVLESPKVKIEDNDLLRDIALAL